MISLVVDLRPLSQWGPVGDCSSLQVTRKAANRALGRQTNDDPAAPFSMVTKKLSYSDFRDRGGGNVEGVQHRLRPHVVRHAPAHHSGAPGVHDHAQIQTTGPRGNIGEIVDLQAIRAGDRWHPLNQVEDYPPLPARTSSEATAAATFPTHPEFEHQSGKALATDSTPLLGQFGRDPRRAVSAPRGFDARLEQGIGPGATRRRAFHPSVLAAGGNFLVLC